MNRRLAWLAFLLAAMVFAGAGVAYADTGYDLSQAPPLFPGGASLGHLTGAAGETAPAEGTGPCVDDAHPSGYAHAALYRLDAQVKTYLIINLFDDLEGSLSTCRLDVYAGSSDAGQFDNPFDGGQRDSFRVAGTEACQAAANCGLAKWLDPGVYYVAAWSLPPVPPEEGSDAETPAEAKFTYNVSARRPVNSSSLAMSGQRITDCKGWNEVVYGRYHSVRVRWAEVGSVRFVLYQYYQGSWRVYRRYTRTLSSGQALMQARIGTVGLWRWRVYYPGSDTVLPATSPAYKSVKVVKPRWARYSDGGTRLYVPFYRQQRALSCEAATYRMAHNFLGSYIRYDTQVYDKTGWDPRRPNVYHGCNPDRAFCGNVDDGYIMRTGYGVHYGPMAKAANAFTPCRQAIALRGYSNATLAYWVNQGFPVVVWGAHKGGSGIYKYNWTAWDGHYVTAYSVEHTWTVIGFHGSPSNPSSFIVADPSTSSAGGVHTVSVSAYYSFAKYFRTAVVVRG